MGEASQVNGTQVNGHDGAPLPGSSSGAAAAGSSDSSKSRTPTGDAHRSKDASFHGHHHRSGKSSRPSSRGARTGHKQPVRIGQYTLQQTLGTGSFGKVKLATHSLTGHRVAMKIINRNKISSLDMGGRVKREIQYLKLLRHPHIVKLYEVITTPSDIIMVIEYAGGELFQYIVDRGRMSEDEARRFFQQIICAIEYCHRHKIVHRDLKPENLLLDEFLNVKIGDFGLSNIMTDGDFLKTSCGSPNYAAPEVISGKLYAGPEIDIWSCGVILYVMLCGRLPFDDEYIPTLFKKINNGIYSIPPYISPEAKALLQSMLVVDPVKRITIAEIRNLPWFQTNLPTYLQPLPPTPAAEPDGFDFNVPPESSAEERPDSPETQRRKQGLVTADLGVVEDSIVDELTAKMVSFSREDVQSQLAAPGENQVKVAYQLLRDHQRMIRNSRLEEQKEMQGFLAQSPPPWNAGLDEIMSRSTSIRRKPSEKRTEGRQHAGRSASLAVAETASASEDAEQSADAEDNTTDLLSGSDDDLFTEDETILTDDEDPEDGARPQTGIGVLESSIPGSASFVGDARDSNLPLPTPQPKKTRSKWHFGIRSRSPPVEIMLELYRTLQVLGMEWRQRPELEQSLSKKKEGGENAYDDSTRGQELFFLETRWKVGEVLVHMDLQLYRVDADNYLVDFRNVGYSVQQEPEGSQSSDLGDKLQQALDQAAQEANGHASASSTDESVESGQKLPGKLRINPKPSLAPAVPTGRKEVCSPFLFLECATRLIVELAGGG